MTRFFSVLAALVLVFSTACGHSAKYYLDKARGESAQGKVQDAEVNYRKAIQLDANNGEAYYQLGSLLLKERKSQDAYGALSRASDMLPDRDDVAAQLADLALASYKADPRHPRVLYDKVNQLSDRLLARNAESYDGVRLKAELAAVDMKFPEAEELYGHANRIKPLQPELVRGWAEVLFRDNRDSQGEEIATQLIARDKSYGPIYDLLFLHYEAAKRPAEAEKILQLRVSNNPADAAGALRLAAYYASASRETEMRAALQKMLDRPKDFPQARLEVGDFYARLRRWDDALALYRQGAQDDSKNKTSYLKKIVDALLAQGKAGQADAVVDQILKLHPDDESAKQVKASFLLATRKPENIDKAIAQMETLVKSNPEDADRHFNLGRALAAKGDLNGATIQFETAVAKRPRFIEPRLALIEISQARGDFKAMLRYSDQLLTLDPRLTRIRVARAVALMGTGRLLDARRELETLAGIAPGDGEIQFQLATLNLRERKFREAEAMFRKLIPDDGGDGRALSGLVQTLASQNHVDDAIAAIRQRLAKAPKSVPLQALLAKTAAETGRYDLAIDQYKQMLAVAPKSEQTTLALGMSYRLKGDFAAAAAYFQKAHELAPNDPEPIVRLAGALAFTGRQAEALGHYRTALKLRPEDPTLLNNTAYLIAETGGNLDEAANLAKKAMKLDARQPNYTDTLGWIYFHKHQDDSAAQVFRGLTERYPNNPTFHYHLGMTLLQEGDKRAANSEFKSALAKNPSTEMRGRIQTALAKAG